MMLGLFVFGDIVFAETSTSTFPTWGMMIVLKGDQKRH